MSGRIPPADDSAADPDEPDQLAQNPAQNPARNPASRVPAGDLAASYHELQCLLLEGDDLNQLLRQVAVVAAGLVRGSSCGITLYRDQGALTAASSDEFALRIDEIQYGREQGPCLEAMATGQEVNVVDLNAEDRWGEYRLHAISCGVRSSFAVPLIVDGATLGALNLYNRRPAAFDATSLTLARAFARQAAMTLALVLRRADEVELQAQMRTALATRTVIDQALGILMGTRRITAMAAFGVLREISQNSSRTLAEVATELIESCTGQPPIPPRSFPKL